LLVLLLLLLLLLLIPPLINCPAVEAPVYIRQSVAEVMVSAPQMHRHTVLLTSVYVKLLQQH
jgi:hypothetical protein